MKNKITFEVIYNPSLIEKTGGLMSKLDLGIKEIEQLQAYTISWNTSTKIDSHYKQKMKAKIKEFFEREGDRVVSIKEKLT